MVGLNEIANRLGEESRHAKRKLATALVVLGVAKTLIIVEAAERLYANRPLRVKDGSRTRSLGGHFFSLLDLHHKSDLRRLKPSQMELSCVVNIKRLEELQTRASKRGQECIVAERIQLIREILVEVFGFEPTFEARSARQGSPTQARSKRTLRNLQPTRRPSKNKKIARRTKGRRKRIERGKQLEAEILAGLRRGETQAKKAKASSDKAKAAADMEKFKRRAHTINLEVEPKARAKVYAATGGKKPSSHSSGRHAR